MKHSARILALAPALLGGCGQELPPRPDWQVIDITVDGKVPISWDSNYDMVTKTIEIAVRMPKIPTVCDVEFEQEKHAARVCYELRNVDDAETIVWTERPGRGLVTCPPDCQQEAEPCAGITRTTADGHTHCDPRQRAGNVERYPKDWQDEEAELLAEIARLESEAAAVRERVRQTREIRQGIEDLQNWQPEEE